jgi:uncharacterized lipoprotein YajG
MKTALRTFVALLAAVALLTACGDDNDDTPTTVPTTVASATTAVPAPSTTVPVTVAQRVTDGAVCPAEGARGTTQGGIAEVCARIAGGNELRWRPA